MKINKVIVPLIICVLLVLSSCGSSKSYDMAAIEENNYIDESAYGYAYDEEYAVETEKTNSESQNNSDTGSNVVPSERKLVRNANLDIQTKEFDKFLTEISDYSSEIGGYVESSTESGYSYDYTGTRYANLTLRIPSDKFEEFINQVSGLAKITSKNITVDDITSKYIDTESRVKSLKAEQKALLKILEDAKTVTETLEIYDKLSDVNYRLENYEAQLKSLDQQVSYSKIEMQINEVERVTQTTGEGFFSQIKEKLTDNLYNIGIGIKSFAIWLISSLPYIAIWAVIIIVIILIIKKVIKRIKTKKKNKSEE